MYIQRDMPQVKVTCATYASRLLLRPAGSAEGQSAKNIITLFQRSAIPAGEEKE